jgi:hypothetical protein
MAWDPKAARTALDSSHLAKFVDERDKLSNFRLPNGREIALIEENAKKVSVYIFPAPHHLPNAVVEEHYPPTTTSSGRHSNLQLITSTLGYNSDAYRIHLKDQKSLDELLYWYQYA